MPGGRLSDDSRPQSSLSALEIANAIMDYDAMTHNWSPPSNTIDGRDMANDQDQDMNDNDQEDDNNNNNDQAVPANENLAPPGLKEISSLASWTVSSAKPDYGVAALRSTRPEQFWQSDGPQPHTLSVHFFKLVSIVSIRVLMDFDTDESYTPTKIQFWAGTGLHDLHEFSEMNLVEPRGWINVDFSRVGPIDPADNDPEPHDKIDWSTRPVLRAFLIQVRILENHQNGKDTHLRGFQVFARDEAHQVIKTAVPLSSKQQQQSKPPVPHWLRDPDLR